MSAGLTLHSLVSGCSSNQQLSARALALTGSGLSQAWCAGTMHFTSQVMLLILLC